MNVARKSVLISPLCWGLGHATRIIPVIRAFQKENCEVSVLANAKLIVFLQERFPNIEYYEDKIPCIRYGLKGMGFFKLLGTAIRLNFRYKKEHRTVRRILKKKYFDIIVSDNRYGIWNRKSRNVLITHQLKPIISGFFSLFEKKVHRYIKKRLNNFEYVWIPDYNKNLLSGKLTQIDKPFEKIKFIGILSRFSKPEINPTTEVKHYFLIITSGPEKHRLKMANYFIKNLADTNANVKIIGEHSSKTLPQNIEVITQPDDQTFANLVFGAACIITHSGYSTLMDLIQLEKNAIIIPTLGQTEQIYLGKRLQNYFVFASNLKQALHFVDIQIDELPKQILKSESYLDTAINEILIH